MANVLQYGLRPVADGSKLRAQRYEIASGYGTALYAYDAVTLVAAGTIERLTSATIPIGIIKEFEFTQNGKRVRDHYLPASTAYTPTARGSVNASYVWVWNEPEIEFTVPFFTTATNEALAHAGVGTNAEFDYSTDTGNTTMKRSGFMLDTTGFTTNDANATVVELTRIPGRDLDAASFKVRCRWGRHLLRSSGYTAGI